MISHRSPLGLNSQASLQQLPTRASWCGQLTLASLSVPVKAYSAIANTDGSTLCQIHKGCGRRVEQPRRCPKHGKLHSEEIAKAYPYSPTQFVELSESDLTGLQPSDDKNIVLENFLDQGTLDLELLTGKSMYLAPSNISAQRPLMLIAFALKSKRKWAVSRIVLSGKEQLIVLYPRAKSLMLHTLHEPRRVRRPIEIDNEGSVKLAECRPLVKAINLADTSLPTASWEDSMEQRLASLVAQKIGHTNKTKKTRRSTKTTKQAKRGRLSKAA